MLFEEFQDGGHLGYRNKTILAILNLCVTVMPPIRFQLNRTYGCGGDDVWRLPRWPPWQPSWISEWNDFSNSESLCRSDASHIVSAQSDMAWEEMSFEEFQDDCHGRHLGYRNGTILAILNLYVSMMSPIKFQLIRTGFWRRCLKNFKMATMAAILDIGTEWF